jgi:uncharacterized membrane protein YphA (DoxX/SURF4 family)
MFSSLGSGSSSRGGASPLRAFRTVSLMRIGTGLVLFYYYGMEAAVRGWQYALKQVPWSFEANLERAAMPFPKVLAVVVALVVIGVSLSWILGFLTRLFAVLFLPIVLGAMLVAERLALPSNHTEMGLLYLLITISLLVSGSGKISLDALFKLGAGQKKRR